MIFRMNLEIINKCSSLDLHISIVHTMCYSDQIEMVDVIVGQQLRRPLLFINTCTLYRFWILSLDGVLGRNQLSAGDTRSHNMPKHLTNEDNELFFVRRRKLVFEQTHPLERNSFDILLFSFRQFHFSW